MDLTKVIMSSMNPNMAFVKSGQFDKDFTGTWTAGTTSQTITNGIDVTKQYVLAWYSANRNNPTQIYEPLPNTVVSQGTDRTAFHNLEDLFADIYFSVNSSGDLIFGTNYGNPGISPYDITVPVYIKVVYYVVEMLAI